MFLPSPGEEACPPETLDVGQIAVFFSVLGPSAGPRPSALCLSSAEERREVLPAHLIPCILPILPLPPGLGPKALSSSPSFHSRALVWGLILCPAPGFSPLLLGLHLAAITAHSAQPGWMGLSDFGDRPAAAGLLVLRPARGPRQCCLLPLTCAQGWLFGNERQPTLSEPPLIEGLNSEVTFVSRQLPD